MGWAAPFWWAARLAREVPGYYIPHSSPRALLGRSLAVIDLSFSCMIRVLSGCLGPHPSGFEEDPSGFEEDPSACSNVPENDSSIVAIVRGRSALFHDAKAKCKHLAPEPWAILV